MMKTQDERSQFRLDGRKAMVTGGGSGLGLAMATALNRAGAHVVLVGRNTGKLETAAGTLLAAGGSVEYLMADLSDADACVDVINRSEAQSGPIDILINNAGIQHRSPALDFPLAEWNRLLDTNLSAPFRLTQRAGQTMKELGGGKIINTLSVLADLGRPTVVPYSVAKAGLKMLTRALAVEWGPLNIQVNGIAPGYFATEMNTALVEDKAFSSWLENRTPMRRWGRAAELGPAAVFLASQASDFITGQVLFVDGGLSAAI